LLPAFFQNLLPEGRFRDQLADLRHCDPLDHLNILTACGRDLPGNVYVEPIALTRDWIAENVTQQQDALEATVIEAPLENAISLSGVQAKLGAVLAENGRYVAPTKTSSGMHVILKLPSIDFPLLPEVELLSLAMARAAGVTVCEASLAPLATLEVEHHYDLGAASKTSRFLAVKRFDRSVEGRIHGEDFAQILGVMPSMKYRAPGASYLNLARIMMAIPSLGEGAVHELLRRMMVNQLLGNLDMHLKNIGVQYVDGVNPQLSPAYDIVAYSVYNSREGHALPLLDAMHEADAKDLAAPKPKLTKWTVRQFCEALRIPEKPLSTTLRRTVTKAAMAWPALLQDSSLTKTQKSRFLAYFTQRLEELAYRAPKA
jgi:serine/threonine-protein kinase HipA